MPALSFGMRLTIGIQREQSKQNINNDLFWLKAKYEVRVRGDRVWLWLLVLTSYETYPILWLRPANAKAVLKPLIRM